MEAVEISVKGKARDAQVGVTNIEARAIYKMPAVGAEPDILQYLQILPGVVFSGDQGGQLYIRGGSPIMNKVMMDGLTIYNPFHSIGLFSVFETDLIQTADVYSAGFGSEYGGRVSAVVDIKTRDGNRKRMAGKVGLTTFTSKLLLESPLRKYQQGKNNSSIAISYKNSFLRESSRLLYNYANPDKLPYNFGDLFVKMSFNSANGGIPNCMGLDSQTMWLFLVLRVTVGPQQGWVVSFWWFQSRPKPGLMDTFCGVSIASNRKSKMPNQEAVQ